MSVDSMPRDQVFTELSVMTSERYADPQHILEYLLMFARNEAESIRSEAFPRYDQLAKDEFSKGWRQKDLQLWYQYIHELGQVVALHAKLKHLP
jgi:hypothetical protein